MNKIVVGCDHTGEMLLEEISNYLRKSGYEVITYKEQEKEDYTDIAKKICEYINKFNCLGIAICGTGIGISIACNKQKSIRASICYDEYTIEMARKHNNLNVLCLGARTELCKNSNFVKKLIDIYTSTDFDGGRHIERIEKIENLRRD